MNISKIELEELEAFVSELERYGYLYKEMNHHFNTLKDILHRTRRELEK